MRTLSTVERTPSAGLEPDDRPIAELELEVEIDDADEHALIAALEDLHAVVAIRLTRALAEVLRQARDRRGRRGARSPRSPLGAVSEADRHNLRGERISVDTIPLVGEEASPRPRCGPSPTCRAPGSWCSLARSWAARSAARPTSCAPRGPDHRPQHGRLDHGPRGPGGQRPGAGGDDGGHGGRGHGVVLDLARQRGRRY